MGASRHEAFGWSLAVGGYSMQPEIIDRNAELLSLTSLRFVAAFYVFLFHMHIRWPLVAPGYLENVLSQGAIGMTIFFMLSGFILSHRYADAPLDWRNYVKSRVARIYPIYLVAAAITLPWMIVQVAHIFTDVPHALGSGTALFVSNIFAIQAWFPQMFSLWNDGSSWSISAEAFFYALFPAIIGLLGRIEFDDIIKIGLVTYVICVFIGFSSVSFGDKTAPFAVFYAMPIFRLPEFVIGIVVYIVSRNIKMPFKSDLILATTLFALLFYLSLFGQSVSGFISHSWLAVPCVAVVLLVLSRGDGVIANRVMSAGILVWGGRISYCFYSFQAFIFLALKSKREWLISHMPVLSDNRLLCIGAFILLLGMSAIGYHWIEEPLRRRLGGRKAAPPSLAIAPIAAESR
jgi:peptidoglycan/LPS O-acetylase OafA/YrhL